MAEKFDNPAHDCDPRHVERLEDKGVREILAEHRIENLRLIKHMWSQSINDANDVKISLLEPSPPKLDHRDTVGAFDMAADRPKIPHHNGRVESGKLSADCESKVREKSVIGHKVQRDLVKAVVQSGACADNERVCDGWIQEQGSRSIPTNRGEITQHLIRKAEIEPEEDVFERSLRSSSMAPPNRVQRIRNHGNGNGR